MLSLSSAFVWHKPWNNIYTVDPAPKVYEVVGVFVAGACCVLRMFCASTVIRVRWRLGRVG